MNNFLLLLLVFSLNSCSMVYAPKAPSNEVSTDLCNRSCNAGKQACATQCATTTSKECIAACDVGFSSCNSECNKTDDVIAELAKLKSKIKV